MRLDLYGGFGEKGRTCLGVESGGYRKMPDIVLGEFEHRLLALDGARRPDHRR